MGSETLTKSSVRKEMKDVLHSMSQEKLRDKSFQICSHLGKLVSYLQSSSVLDSRFIIGLYAAMADEVKLGEFVKNFSGKMTLSFPYCRDERMEFRKCQEGELVPGNTFGVKLLAPPEKAEVVVPDILIIPGVAFDRDGNRLGRGKGFYDQYLCDFKGQKVGICFEEQRINKVPTEDHDVKLDFVVSESGISGTGDNSF